MIEQLYKKQRHTSPSWESHAVLVNQKIYQSASKDWFPNKYLSLNVASSVIVAWYAPCSLHIHIHMTISHHMLGMSYFKFLHFGNELTVFNPLVPVRYGGNIKFVIFEHTLRLISLWALSIAPRGIPHNTGEYSTLVQVTVWCCLTTCPYLSQCWPRWISSYRVIRSLCIKRLPFRTNHSKVIFNIFYPFCLCKFPCRMYRMSQ